MALQEEFEEQGVWLFTYRSYLPLVILGIGLGLYTYTEMHPESFFIKGTAYEWAFEMACLAVGLLGLFVRIYTVGYSAKNTSGRNVKEQVADSLNTTGIYSTLRHPLYLGNFLMWLGPALMTGNFWFIIAFCLFYWVYYERIMFAEEQYLRRKFGDIYLEWSKGVPAFMPSFKNFVKPAYDFTWKKVLKKEKNGVFALFMIFSAFDAIGEYLNHTSDYNLIFLGGTVATGLSYIVLKVIRMSTDLLNEDNR